MTNTEAVFEVRAVVAFQNSKNIFVDLLLQQQFRE